MEKGTIRWTLPGRYGRIVNSNRLTILHNEFRGIGCLLLDIINNRFYGTLTDCKARHPIMCVYNEHPLLQLACPTGSFTTRYQGDLHGQCLSIYIPQNVLPVPVSYEQIKCQNVFLLNSIEDTIIYRHLTKIVSLKPKTDKCLVRIVDLKMTEFLTLSPNEFNNISNQVYFVNWARTWNGADEQQQQNVALVLDTDGKWRWDTYVSGVVCQQTIERSTPKIVLEYYDVDHFSTGIFMYIYFHRYIWRENGWETGVNCFSKDSTIREINFSEVFGWNIDAVRKYKLNSTMQGYYWCEGISIGDFYPIQSNKMFAYGDVFAVSAQSDCIFVCGNELILFEFKKYLYSILMTSHHMPYISFEDVKIVQTTQISVGIIETVFHITIDLSDSYQTTEPNNLNVTEPILRAYLMMEKLNDILDMFPNEFRIMTVRNTKYCLPLSISILEEFNWPGAYIGMTIPSMEICLAVNGMPVLRQCDGSQLVGGFWRNVTDRNCYSNANHSPVTHKLFDLNSQFLEGTQRSATVEQVAMSILNTSATLIPGDVFFISEILQRVSSFSSEKYFEEQESNNIYSIYNSLMELNEYITIASTELNSTNRLLDCFDELVNSLSPTNTMSVVEGLTITPKLITFIVDPYKANITGIGLMKKATAAGNIDLSDLTNYDYKLLYKNQSIQGLLMSEPNLQIASFIPDSLLKKLAKFGDKSMKLVFVIFHNDVLFQVQPLDSQKRSRTNSMIISVTIPGYESATTNLTEIIPTYFKSKQNQPITDNVCAYWNHNASDGWSIRGCHVYSSNAARHLVVCGCTHLTHFVHLVNNVQYSEANEYALTVITYVGSAISLLGIAGIFLTALIFRKWRSKLSTKFLLQLSLAFGLQHCVVSFISSESLTEHLLATNNHFACILIGVLMHYSTLVAFIWMLIIAYLQFLRYVIVFTQMRSDRFLLKASLIGWGIPAIIIIIVLLIDAHTYIPKPDQSVQICYPTDNIFYFACVLPIGVVIVANFVIFILVVYNVTCGAETVIQNNNRDLIVSQLRVAIFLFFLLGLNWIFSFMTNTEGVGLIFAYLLVITIAMQGFILFLYFVVLDPFVRAMWYTYLRKTCCMTQKGKLIIEKVELCSNK